jgi:hypothetical protein
MTDPDLRASDDERQATTDRLAAHYRAGRLTEDELEERSAKANAALTRGELVALESDLPGDAGSPESAAVAQAKRRRERLVSAVAVSAFLWVIWAATDFGGFAWPIFPTAALLLGVVLDTWGGRDEDDDDERRGGPPRMPRPPAPPPLGRP